MNKRTRIHTAAIAAGMLFGLVWPLGVEWIQVEDAFNFALALHIDTDESNVANVQTCAQGFIVGIQSEA